jgi:2-polyprenyl-6-methoxyphenol hydroxylase-like FAD-dependent oxidoreductase
MTRTALVVGAGIGGLSAGIALRRAGWNVRIFERAATSRELGFGLLLAPNAIAALRELGVADDVLARGAAPAKAEVRRPDGTVLKRADFPPPEALGGPMVVALRQALHGVLLDAVGLDAIEFGNEAASFSATDSRVTLRLAHGQQVEGDLLVGADGVGSVIRRELHPSEPAPRSSGLVAVRGAVHGVLHHLGDLSAVYYLGPGIEAATVRASDTGIYWFLSITRELAPAGVTDPAAVVAHLAPRFDETFRAVASATTEMRFDELIDRDPLPSWGRGVVTLLGDAAHPMLPQTGQGAAQAIVDAARLGAVMKDHNSLDAALRAYEAERRVKTAALVAQGRRTARIMRMTNPVAIGVRDVVIRLIPVNSLVRVVATLNRRAGATPAS